MEKILPVYDWGQLIPDTARVVEIHAKDGVYIRGLVKIGNQVIIKVIGKTSEKKVFPDLPEMSLAETGLHLSVNKLPSDQFAQIAAFFKYAFDRYQSEAVVILYMNPTMNGGTWCIEAPVQKVTRASVDYEQPKTIPQGWLYAGTIHSHAAMNAFHSGTDAKDENDTNGFHITYGAHGDLDAKFMLSGWQFDINPNDLIELNTTFPEEWKNQITVGINPIVKTWYPGKKWKGGK